MPSWILCWDFWPCQQLGTNSNSISIVILCPFFFFKWRNISLFIVLNIMCVIMIIFIGIPDWYWYFLEPERLMYCYNSLLWAEFDQNIFSRKANIWFECKRWRIHYLSWYFHEQLCMLIIQSMFRNFKCIFFFASAARILFVLCLFLTQC